MGQNWTRFTVDSKYSGVGNIQLADADNNGYPDILTTYAGSNVVVLYENSGGDSIVWTEHIVDEYLDGAFGSRLGDMDGDDDLDIAVTARNAGVVVWYANEDGSLEDWTKNTIGTGVPNAWDLILVHLSSASFPDVVVNQWNNNASIFFYRNPLADSTDTALSGLSLDPAGTLDPPFDPDTISYSAEVPYGTETVTVVASTRNPYASTSGDGEIDVSSGNETATVVVTAENGVSTRTYTVDITVGADPSGITDALSGDFRIYPTGARGTFHVEFPGRSGTVTVFDMTGRVIRQPELINETKTVHIGNSGIYILRLESEGISKSVKILHVR